MAKIRNKVTLLNIIASFFSQIVSIISALIIPRLILSTFGSHVNGLVSSILQFLNYIALIEGGVTGVISANLYKPLVEEDRIKINSVLTTARYFYRVIGLIFIGYSLVVGLLYPLLVETGYEYKYVFFLTLVLSIGLLVQYMFSLTYTTLLNADKKVYLVSFISSILTIANIILSILVIRLFPDILILKITNAVVYAFAPLFYSSYVKKHFAINWKTKKDNSLIKQRWSGFAINFAFFIHTSTDITLLTLFSDLKTVSVYSIYYLITSKISVLINSVVSGIEPTIGQAYAQGNIHEINEKLDLYEFIILFSVGLLFLLTGLLITPFVMIYTKGVVDADYYQPCFGVILVISEAIYLLRSPHVSLAYAANKFREITLPAYIEAVINIVVSMVLIKKLGLIGVAVGTLTGMLYRLIFQVYYTSKLIPSRPAKLFYRKLWPIVLTCFLCSLICTNFFPITTYSFLEWLYHAVIYGLISLGIFAVTANVFFKKEITFFKKYIKK